MMRCMVLLGMLFWAPLAVAYEETVKIPGSPELRIALGPRDAIENHGYVTGQFVMRVQIVTGFAFEALDFKFPEIENARVVTLLKPRTKTVDTVAGTGFIFETAFAIFPTKSGELVIPPLIADGQIQPEGEERIPFHTESAEQRIPIKGIAARLPDDWWIVSNRIEVDETWSKPLDQARPGDIIRREVVMTVYGAEAERLPPLTLGDSIGVTASDHGGTRKTLKSTEGVIGRVSRSWNIRIDDPVLARIGAVEIGYWHPSDHRVEIATAPAQVVEPLPVSPDSSAVALLEEAELERRAGAAAGLTLAGLAAAPFLFLFAALVWAFLPSRHDTALRRALKSAETNQTKFRAIDNWAQAEGVDLTDPPVSYLQLSRSLFASDTTCEGAKSIAHDLLSVSREQRISFIKSKAYGIVTSILGRDAKLHS